MARRCTNDGSPGLCCAAFSKGIPSGQVFTHPDASGRLRCHVCTVINRSKGRGRGFQHRFAKSAACSLVSGCAALSGQTGGTLTIGQGGGGVPSV